MVSGCSNSDDNHQDARAIYSEADFIASRKTVEEQGNKLIAFSHEPLTKMGSWTYPGNNKTYTDVMEGKVKLDQ